MLNWLTRYVPALDALEGAGSILDVGCGSHGLACVAPERPFVGADVAFPTRTAAQMVPFTLEPGPELPFPDGSFDVVLCLDVLEHVPGPERAAFVAELARVAARRVVLACPTDRALVLDDLVAERSTGAGLPVPGWLQEHRECGLPTRDELAALIAGLGPGFRVRELDMPDGLLCTLVVLADTDPDPKVARAAADAYAGERPQWVELLRAASRAGTGFRAGLVLDRVAPLAPRVPAGLDRDGLAEAVAALATDLPPLDTRATTKLWLSPEDWGRPQQWLGALARYLTAAAPDGDTCLALDARPRPGLEPSDIVELIAAACDRLAGDASFAEVLVVDAPVDAAGAIRVSTAADVERALGAPPVPVPEDPHEIVDAARWAKALADDLGAQADRRRFEATPAPNPRGGPLVSVRIPTWNGVERLVSSTIPSVLGGSYPNVEVLVCSDGPDPECRRAIEAAFGHDPRVRYLELPDRPAHPQYPWSFWETTGLLPANAALDLARGDFIAPLDHDDRFTAEHIHDLLGAAARHGADFVHAQTLAEPREPGAPPTLVGTGRLAHGHICHGAVLYSRRLAHLRYDPYCWLDEQPGDWNMWSRMAATGATTAYLDRVVLVHGAERTSIEGRLSEAELAGGVRRTAADLAPDVLGTDARWLLDVVPLHAGAPAP